MAVGYRGRIVTGIGEDHSWASFASANRAVRVRRVGAINRVRKKGLSGSQEMNLMSNQLTSASDGCNRETGEGQEHAGSKASPGRYHRRLSGSQDKTCMVNAALRETQIGVLALEIDAPMVNASFRVKGEVRRTLGLILTTRPTLRRRANDRTSHLNTSHLYDCVNTGSPKRIPFWYSVWRQSHHISQTPEVMLGTAICEWTGTRETDLATERGISTARVKGGATAKANNFMTVAR